MANKKERFYLNQLKETLKNPPLNKYVLVYTEIEGGLNPVNQSKERITLKQVVDIMNDGFKRMDAKMDVGFKQVNTRLDYIVKANNLKDLPKSK